MTPASSLVQQDDAFTIDINPAGVALLPAWSMGYVHAEVDQRDSWLGRGDAFYLAAPLWFGLGAGLTMQSVRPDELAKHPGRVLTHAHMLRTAWGPAQEDQTEYLRVAVRALRQKLEENPSTPRLIVNEPAVGYRLVTG